MKPQCDWIARDESEMKDTVFVHCQSRLGHEKDGSLHDPGPPAVSGKPYILGPWFRKNAEQALMRDYLE